MKTVIAYALVVGSLLVGTGLASPAGPYSDLTLSPDAPSTRTVIDELFWQSRFLEDAHFSVPVNVYTQYVREAITGPAEPLPPVAIIATEGIYQYTNVNRREAKLEVQITFDVLDTRKLKDGVKLLSDKFEWRDIKLNGQAAKLHQHDGFWRFYPSQPGNYVLKATHLLGVRARLAGGAALHILRTSRTILRIEGPSDKYIAKVGGENSAIRPVKGKRMDGEIALRPRDVLTIHVQRADRERFHRATQYRISGEVAWNFETGSQQVTAVLNVKILGSDTDSMSLTLPANAEKVSVTGPDLRDSQISRVTAKVFFRGKISGQTRLRVSYEIPTRGESQKLQAISVRNGQWENGTLVVTSTIGTSEVLDESKVGLTEISLGDIPPPARAIMTGPAVLAYKITSRRWSVGVELLDLGEFALQESIADLGHFQAMLRDDGSLICKVKYEIRNRNRQFVRLDLPAGSRILLAAVNETPAPVSPVEGQADAYMLPLIRSKASIMGLVSFPLEIVYVCRVEKFASSGKAQIPLARIDLPVAYSWCELYVPEGMDVDEWSGPMRRVKTYSSETATAHMSYGRAELADGYKLENRNLPSTVAIAQPAPKGTLSLPSPVMQPKPHKPPSAKPFADVYIGGRFRSVSSLSASKAAVLGQNYFRAGKDFYELGDYANAESSLNKVVELAPQTPEAQNAKRLLANIKLARGQAKLHSRSQRAAGAQVRRKQKGSSRKLYERQSEYISKGAQAAAEGRYEEARVQLQAAKSVTLRLEKAGALDAQQRRSLGKLEAEIVAAEESVPLLGKPPVISRHFYRSAGRERVSHAGRGSRPAPSPRPSSMPGRRGRGRTIMLGQRVPIIASSQITSREISGTDDVTARRSRQIAVLGKRLNELREAQKFNQALEVARQIRTIDPQNKWAGNQVQLLQQMSEMKRSQRDMQFVAGTVVLDVISWPSSPLIRWIKSGSVPRPGKSGVSCALTSPARR